MRGSLLRRNPGRAMNVNGSTVAITGTGFHQSIGHPVGVQPAAQLQRVQYLCRWKD